MKKLSKINKKIFEALQEKQTELSTNVGKWDKKKNPKPNTKTRKHSGRVEIYVDDEDYPYQEVFWNDWNEYRDGFRDNIEKGKKINKKQKHLRANICS